MIKTGDRLPDATFHIMTGDGPGTVSTADVFGGKTVVMFAVPGAFTPTCHMNHLPGFVENADALKAKGVDEIAVTAVNDVFVMQAWKDASGAGDAIQFLADGNGSFADAIDLTLDGSGFGLGTRSQRYAMLVRDGVVEILNVEDVASSADQSSAASLLAAMG
jgi:peroxiredoxin